MMESFSVDNLASWEPEEAIKRGIHDLLTAKVRDAVYEIRMTTGLKVAVRFEYSVDSEALGRLPKFLKKEGLWEKNYLVHYLDFPDK